MAWPSTDEALSAVAAWEHRHGITAEEALARFRYVQPVPGGMTEDDLREGAEAMLTLQRCQSRDRRQRDLAEAERTEAFAVELVRRSARFDP